jgi:hypothetical protein
MAVVDDIPGGLLQPGVAEPALQPLENSFTATQLEADLQKLFIGLFQSMLRPDERTINVFGAPHLGTFELVERNIKRDGLAMYRGADEGAMRYLYNAWRGRNPKRGLAFTQIYLQMLFPNQWSLTQLWQDKNQPYPTALADADGGHHFLTSRVRVSIQDENNAQAVLAVAASIRSTVPARILVIFRLIPNENFVSTMGFTNGLAGLAHGNFSGTIG